MARKLRIVIDNQEFVVNGWAEVYQYDDDESKPEQLVARYTKDGNKFEAGSLEQPLTGDRKAKLAPSQQESAPTVPVSASANFGAQPGQPATIAHSLSGALAGNPGQAQATFAGPGQTPTQGVASAQVVQAGPGGMGQAANPAINPTGHTGANPPPPHGATGQPQGVQTGPQAGDQVNLQTGAPQANPTINPTTNQNLPGNERNR